MVKKILKWTSLALGSLVLLLLLFYGIVYAKTEADIHKVYAVTLQPLPIPDDSAEYIAGRHIAEIRGCLGCHGANLATGEVFADEHSPIGYIQATNITSGKGGIQYTDQDWIRALRHGLGKDNRSLWFMPSHEICGLSNQDMAALISYVKKQPPVDKTTPPKSIKPLGRILTFLGEFPLLPAKEIDHTATYVDEVKPAINADYGKYLAVTCTGCHTASYKGAPSRSPEQPPIPDISSTGHLGSWTQQDFVKLFHNGRTPEGRVLSPYMPVKSFTYSDDELKAIYLFLHEVN
ncbi:cytochrome c [Spirosoma sp. KCTC 42546]|uniref:cytochrome c n=1 Tax=Spirosoma sp. KCTC 42546 TaxID=2520506 RepID=UPI00115C1A6F|nr:cytochrome c [Spirosoma sp. KCTC 42546]QDK81891.1 cytochrome c [Spirosoma sp. KCTC 42546]